jgi:GNAT superfamily N-acetyltransferase
MSTSSNVFYVREATPADIGVMHTIRCSVKENILSDPAKITEADYRAYITERGKGWVAETDGEVWGFAIADLDDRNVWALFVHPVHEKKGVGKSLHEMMLHWYFSQTHDTLWLSTSPGTRAETFYRAKGWKEAGTFNDDETRFEMSYEDYLQLYRHLA